MAIAPLTPTISSYIPPLNNRLEGVLHQLDHPATLAWADKWVPFVAYPGLVGAEMVVDQVKAKPEERRKTFIHDALTLGIPAIGTWAATHAFMTPKREMLATTTAAVHYINQHYPQLLAVVEQTVKKDASSGARPFIERLTQAPETIRPKEVTHLANARTSLGSGQITSQRLDQLVKTAQASVLEHAAKLEHAGKPVIPPDIIAQGYEATCQWAKQNNVEVPNLEWPLRLADERKKFGGSHKDHSDGLPVIQKLAEQFLLKNELRLLLPFNEEFESAPNVFTHPPLEALKHTWTNTLKDLQEEALPFFKTGVASILSGTVGGLLANKVEGAPATKNRDVVNESVFQVVSNITMCALGATVGMGAANLAGFTKFTHPMLRLGTIAAGLAAGITVGANSANALTQRWLSPVIDRAFGLKDAEPSAYRPITKNDIALHLDDLPFALAASGASILKTLTPPLFYAAARQTSHGFSSVASAHSQSSKKHHPPHSEIHSMMQPTAQSPALVGYPNPMALAPSVSDPLSHPSLTQPSAVMAPSPTFQPALMESSPAITEQLSLPKPASTALTNGLIQRVTGASVPAMAQVSTPESAPKALAYVHHSRQFDPYAALTSPAKQMPAAASATTLDTAMQAVTIQPGTLNATA
jgi:hypothetical protein